MATPRELDFLMFVSGEPDNATNHVGPALSVPMRLVMAVIPLGLVVRFASPPGSVRGVALDDVPSASTPWHLPADQIHCVNSVLEAAIAERRFVTLVDVNRASAPPELVQQYVSPNDIFPILIRPDGQRIEGVENFSPKVLRRVLRGPRSPPLPSG
jgi:hypothetical protein